MKLLTVVRSFSLAAASLAALLAVAADAWADGPDPAVSVTRGPPEVCDSVVRTNCGLPNWHFDRTHPQSAGKTTAALARADATLRKRRLADAASNGEADDSVIVSGERITDPNDTKWQRFDEQVSDAVVPDCLSVGQNMGLLALPLVPLMAANGRCN